MDLTEEETQQLIRDIATRAGTAKEIAKWYGATQAELRAFVDTHRDELEGYNQTAVERAEPDPQELADLWITNKFERLKRLQAMCDAIVQTIEYGAVDQALLRELRSYMALAANELGQLLHRGSGDSAENTVLEVDIAGVDMEQLR